VGDPEARYFGGRVEELSLVPLGEARLLILLIVSGVSLLAKTLM
jgi:hypothetical protein